MGRFDITSDVSKLMDACHSVLSLSCEKVLLLFLKYEDTILFIIPNYSTILVGDHSILRINLFMCVVGGSNILSNGGVVLQCWPK